MKTTIEIEKKSNAFKCAIFHATNPPELTATVTNPIIYNEKEKEERERVGCHLLTLSDHPLYWLYDYTSTNTLQANIIIFISSKFFI